MRAIDADALDLALDQVKLNDLLDTLDALCAALYVLRALRGESK